MGVTIKGNAGSAFLQIKNPFNMFMEDINKVISESVESVTKFQSYLSQKIKEASSHPSGPVTEALTATKTELEKLRPEVNKKKETLDGLNRKVSAGRTTF